MARKPKGEIFPELQDIEREMSQVRSKGRYRRALRGTIGTVVVVAALAVLIPQPLMLFQSSFQLSFACVVCVGIFFPAPRAISILPAATLLMHTSNRTARCFLPGAA